MEEKQTKLDYHAERMEKMIGYVRSHISEELQINYLATEVAAMSTAHFERIARAYLGETVVSFINRTRLECAARLLRNTDLPITIVAERAGYQCPTSLAKVFQKYYHMSPTAFRNSNTTLRIEQSKVNLAAKPISLAERIETRLPVRSISIRHRADYEKMDYVSAWSALFSYAEAHHINLENAEYIAVFYDDPCDPNIDSEQMTVDVCLSISDDYPAGLTNEQTIAGGRYAVFTYVGTYKKLEDAYDTIFGRILIERDYELDNRPIFEKYVNDPAVVPPSDLITEIYVPIV